jgi:hypothetical protein
MYVIHSTTMSVYILHFGFFEGMGWGWVMNLQVFPLKSWQVHVFSLIVVVVVVVVVIVVVVVVVVVVAAAAAAAAVVVVVVVFVVVVGAVAVVAVVVVCMYKVNEYIS